MTGHLTSPMGKDITLVTVSNEIAMIAATMIKSDEDEILHYRRGSIG